MEVAAAAAVAALGAWVVHRRANRFRGAFIGYCSAGLERRAAEEVESLPGGTVLAAWRPAGNGRAIMGTVLFRLEDPTLATGLRAFQQVEALVTVAGGVPSGREEGPAFIFETARRGCWPEALDLVRRVIPSLRDVERPVCRAVALRNGTHSFTSPQAAAMAGGAAHIGGGLPIKMRGFDIVISCIVTDGHVNVGILLGMDSLRNHHTLRDGYTVQLADRPSTAVRMEGLNREYALRASTANLLLHLARPQPGDVVLDCMTGTGTVNGEAAASFPVFSLGSDMNEPAIKRANAVFGGPSEGKRPYTPRQLSDFALADATRLPYRRATVDCCVVELPFGKRCGQPSALPALYTKFTRDMARVVRPGGRAVVVAANEERLAEALRKSGTQEAWSLRSVSPMVLGGLNVLAFVLRRGSGA